MLKPQDISPLVITSFIAVTCMFAEVVLIFEENLCDDYRGRVSTYISEMVRYVNNPETESVMQC